MTFIKIETDENGEVLTGGEPDPLGQRVGRFGSGLVLTQNQPDNSGPKNCSPEFTGAVPGWVLGRFYGSFFF